MLLLETISLFLALDHADEEAIVFNLLGWSIEKIFPGQTQPFLELCL